MTATPPPATPAPAVAAPKQTLSLISFIAGIASIVFTWIPVLGFLVAVAAIILGFLGRKREPGAPTWMALVGIITGFVGALLGILFFFLIIIFPLIALAAAGSSVYNQ